MAPAPGYNAAWRGVAARHSSSRNQRRTRRDMSFDAEVDAKPQPCRHRITRFGPKWCPVPFFVALRIYTRIWWDQALAIGWRFRSYDHSV